MSSEHAQIITESYQNKYDFNTILHILKDDMKTFASFKNKIKKPSDKDALNLMNYLFTEDNFQYYVIDGNTSINVNHAWQYFHKLRKIIDTELNRYKYLKYLHKYNTLLKSIQ